MGDPMNPTWFRRVLGQYPTGVWVVTATEPDGRRAGFVVGSFTSVSLDPPLVAFFPDKGSTSWPRIHRAGKFCVNILGAEQEDVCRNFASRTPDKFADIAYREAESGAPIITGAVAWIDCDLESVTEAGDHYIVLGRVRRLGIENPSLPLLFFRGGYGRFTPLSRATGDTRLTEQLREVDLIRPEVDRLVADIPGALCNVWVLVGDELVLIASAGAAGSGPQATLVGQRLPFIPPLRNGIAAWMDDAELEKWLTLLPSDDARADERARLAVVRERGYSASIRTDAQQEFEAALARLAVDPDAVDRQALYGHIGKLDHELVSLSAEAKSDIAVIRVPVFAPSGGVEMQISVYGYPKPSTARGIDAYIERVCGAGRRATELVGGRPYSLRPSL